MRATKSSDILIVKIGVESLAVRRRNPPTLPPPQKKLADSLLYVHAAPGEKKRDGITMKFCTGVEVPGLIIHAKFSDYRLREAFLV